MAASGLAETSPALYVALEHAVDSPASYTFHRACHVSMRALCTPAVPGIALGCVCKQEPCLRCTSSVHPLQCIFCYIHVHGCLFQGSHELVTDRLMTGMLQFMQQPVWPSVHQFWGVDTTTLWQACHHGTRPQSRSDALHMYSPLRTPHEQICICHGTARCIRAVV